MVVNQRWNLDNHKLRRDQILRLLQNSPREHGIDQTRWRLTDMMNVLNRQWDVEFNTLSTLHNWLSRLGIRYRRGWEHITSPDPHLELKLSVIDHALQLARCDPNHVIVLWLDELTVYRLPSPAPAWTDANGRPAKAHHTPGEDTKLRLGGVLNTHTGQVTTRMADVFGTQQLCAFYQQIRDTYPDAEYIFVIQDCWPVHFLTEVRRTAHDCGIRLLPLPTYSSWRNPIEKLWRWLKQSVIHMHPWADDWQRLQTEIIAFLHQFHNGSSRLLHYVGLSD